MVVLGTTGEYPSFGTAERKAVMEVAGKNKDGMNIICSSGTSNFTETIELSKHAADHGAEGLLVIPPFYYKKPPLAGLVRITRCCSTRCRRAWRSISITSRP